MPSKQTNTAGTDAAGTLTALVLQGGGALGAYQAGACEALATRMQDVDWVAGVSIGAINAALIAGNAPEQRIDRLRQFWERVSLPMVENVGRSTYIVDLNGTASIDPVGTPDIRPWGSGAGTFISQLRFDPHEDPGGRSWHLDDVKLLRDETADGGKQR